VKRLANQVAYCRLANSSTLECKNLLGKADSEGRLAIASAKASSSTSSSLHALLNDEDPIVNNNISAMVDGYFKCFNCDERHRGDCPKLCKYCLGNKKEEAATTHELMDCIAYRKFLGKRKTVPNYLIKKREEDAPEGWYSRNPYKKQKKHKKEEDNKTDKSNEYIGH
jgi:hypothetical protein